MTALNLASLKVKDVVTFAKGKPPAAQPYFGKDAEVYLTPEYLRGGVGTEPIKAHKNAARVRSGETIVLWDGSNAGEVFKAKAGVLSSTMVELQPDDSFTADYFYYAMKGWEGYLKGQTSGSGIPHVDKEVIGKLDLLAFSKPEQSKIAEILATVDQAIEQTEALIDEGIAEVLDELLLGVVAGVHLGERPQLGVRPEHQVHRGCRPLDLAGRAAQHHAGVARHLARRHGQEQRDLIRLHRCRPVG